MRVKKQSGGLFFRTTAPPAGGQVPSSAEIFPFLLYILLFLLYNQHIKISIDTRSSVVAQEVLKYGNYIINDVSGLEFDKDMAKIIAQNNATVVIQHSKGTPEIMQDCPVYESLTDEIFLDLKNKIDFAKNSGIEKIIIDVGIGFGKTQSHNIELIKRIGEFKSLSYPIMLGTSRKSFLGVTNNDNELKDALTLGYNALAINAEVDYLRVHNVKLHKEFLNSFYL